MSGTVSRSMGVCVVLGPVPELLLSEVFAESYNVTMHIHDGGVTGAALGGLVYIGVRGNKYLSEACGTGSCG